VSDKKTGQLVTVRGASKFYGDLAALNSLDLTIEPGNFTVLLGPSGSGKSTLIRSLAGIERIDQGSIFFGSESMTEGDKHVAPEKRNLAMVFQDYALWPHLTARENVAYAIKRRSFSRDKSEKHVVEILNRVGLGHKLNNYPSELSGGEQQRVALARAIVAKPSLLLFDEPLSNLDAKLRAHTRLEIQKLHRELGTTSLFVTHDQVEAMTLAQRMLVMNEGRLQQFGTPEEVYNRPANTFVAGFIGAPPMNLLHEMSGIDTEMILGIRPEHLHIKNASHADGRNDAYSWAAQVYAIEMLGAERLVYARIGQEDVVLRTDVTSNAPEIGGTLELIAYQHQVHWFDKKTGLRQS